MLTSMSVVKYLHDSIKVDGKPGQLGSVVGINRVG
jgi:hypothetical protein